MFRSQHLLHAVFSVAVIALTARAVHAGGFSTARFGGERTHAASDQIGTIYYNPAGLAYGSGTRGAIEGLFAYRTIEYTRPAGAIDDANGADSGTPDDAVAANAGKATLANTLASPFVGIATDGGIEGLGVGVGVYVPFGGQAKWDQNDAYRDSTAYPGAVDGPQRWAAIEGEQRSLYYTLAGAWRTKTGSFAVGGALNVVQSSVSLIRARNLDGSDDLVSTGGVIKEGRSLVEGEGIQLGAGLGVMFKPTPCSRIGLSYQSQPGFGEMTLKGTLTNKFGTGAPTVSDIEVRQALPDVVRVAGEWNAFTKAALHVAFDYQRWSQYKNTCIMSAGATGKCEVSANGSTTEQGILVNVPRNWADTYTIRAGGRYFASEQLELNGGLTFDTSAIPYDAAKDDSIDPSLFDMNKIIAQAGVAFATGKLDLTFTLGHVLYLERTVQPRGEDPLAPSRNPDMAGTYKSQVTYGILGVGVKM
jgi:long-chain fatty acid transport protein